MRAAIFNILSERISRNLRKDFYESVINKDIAFFDERRTGDLISRLNADVQVVQDSLGSSISMFVRAAVFIIVVLVILIVISPKLAGMTFAGILPLVVITKCQINLMRSLQRIVSTEKGKMNNVAEESFSNIRTVKAFSSEDDEIAKFYKGNYVVYQAGRTRALYQSGFAFLTQLMLYGSMAAVVYLASVLYQDNEISIGELSTFLFYMMMLVFNFMMASWVLNTLANLMGASDKIVEVMDAPITIESAGGGDIIEGDIDGRLEIRNAKFRYPSKTDV